MKKSQKFIVAICILMLISSFAMPASANSAQQEWDGRDESGVMTMDGECPLIVEHETLTFDLQEFPNFRYGDGLSVYTGKVSAEYTFYNPSDITVTARLAFPLTKTFQTYPHEFTNYQITVNGEKVDSEIRHTLSSYNTEFDVAIDLPRLKDEYISDDFFTGSDLTVTEYVMFMPEFEGGEYWGGARCGIDINPADYPNTIFCFSDDLLSHRLDDGTYRVYTGRVYPWTKITYYAIGDVPNKLPQFKIYYDFHCNDNEVLATGSITSRVATLTLSDLIFMNYDESRGVSRVDWYNAKLELMQRRRASQYPMCHVTDLTDWYDSLLMVWYCYEITLEPGERIVNKVSASMYPDVNTAKDPTRYTYNYLLSPASTWKSFGTLDIYINTPYYISNSSLGDFEVTDNGYKLSLDGLPKDKDESYKELKFTLTSEPIPLQQTTTKFKAFLGSIGSFFKNIFNAIADLFELIFKA